MNALPYEKQAYIAALMERYAYVLKKGDIVRAIEFLSMATEYEEN